MKTPLLLLLLVFSTQATHIIPDANYGPPYFYNADPAKRIYKLPVAAGESSYISGGWVTDSHPGYRHADFAADFDTKVGQWAYAARAGKVMYIEEAPGGLPSYYTIQIGHADSIRDSLSPRGNGWRQILTLDMYRHMNGSTKLVKIGDFVAQGAPIAKVNEISHVHFEVNISNWNAISPIDSLDKISSIPVAFQEITSRPQGFPEMYDTYVSQNTPIRIEIPRRLNPLTSTGLSLITYPNPFRPSTSLGFSLAAPEPDVSLKIYDAAGHLTETLLLNSFMDAGFYSIPWTPACQAKGNYLVKLQAGGKIMTRRIQKQ